MKLNLSILLLIVSAVVVAIIGGIYLFSLAPLQIRRPDVLMGKYGSISDINIVGPITRPDTPYLDTDGNPIKTPTTGS